jgi:hypothetical protein
LDLKWLGILSDEVWGGDSGSPNIGSDFTLQNELMEALNYETE